MAYALWANVTGNKRPAYEAFLASQGAGVVPSTVIRDPKRLGAASANKSVYLPCMYVIHTPALFNGLGDYFQNMDGSEIRSVHCHW